MVLQTVTRIVINFFVVPRFLSQFVAETTTIATMLLRNMSLLSVLVRVGVALRGALQRRVMDAAGFLADDT